MSSDNQIAGIVTRSVESAIPHRIYWHEGMLLSQHLFQRTDLRNFQVVAKKLSLVSRYNWGVITIDVDKSALPNGLFRLNKIEAVFQDGLMLQYVVNAQNGVKPFELKLNEITDNEITVYIAITALSNQTSPLSGSNPRFYVIDGVPIADDNLPGNETVIPELIPNAFLCYTIPEGCIGFPIAKILHESGSFTELDFTPPCFYIAKNSLLWKRCSELIVSLRDKINILSEKISYKNTASPEILTLSVMTMTTLEAFLLSDDIKPCDLFRELVKVLRYASVIDVFSSELLSTIPQYRHDDINSCLLPIINLIERYTSLVGKGYTSLHFNKHEHFFYRYISQEDINCAENGKFYIGIRGSNTASITDIIAWMKGAIIASDFALDNVRLKRTSGAVRREISDSVMTKIMPGMNVTLFEIEIHSNYIKAEQNLHVFNPSNKTVFHPIDVILYLPFPDNCAK